MMKKFDNTILNIFGNELKEASQEMKYIGDISDFGNEIGYRLSNLFHDWDDNDTKVFIDGIKHGIDLKRREIKIDIR